MASAARAPAGVGGGRAGAAAARGGRGRGRGRARRAAARAAAQQASGGRVAVVAPAAVEQRVGEGWTLVDIRDQAQHDRAQLDGAKHVPLFVSEEANDATAMGRKAVVFGTIGWFSGQQLTRENEGFVQDVEAAVGGNRADSRVLLACQTGLRSELAAQRLLALGFGEVAYVVGGLNAAKGAGLKTTGERDIWEAGKGGVSQYFNTIVKVVVALVGLAWLGVTAYIELGYAD